MNRQRIITASAIVIAIVGLGAVLQRPAVSDEKHSPVVYELRTYTTNEGRLDALHQRFRNHTMKIFEKHGMKNIAYWTPAETKDTLVYIIAHKSLEAANASWDAFRNDPEWKAAYEASIVDGKIVKKVDKQFLTATDYSPMK
ncbi:MAG: NIPSNAP family protein [Rhodopirellula sp.]|nr:NIPSNAP family protein [Rhodopirellula sp.]